jgi:hypothetical protein
LALVVNTSTVSAVRSVIVLDAQGSAALILIGSSIRDQFGRNLAYGLGAAAGAGTLPRHWRLSEDRVAPEP